MRIRVTLLSILYFAVWGCSPEEIVEVSAPIYEIGVQEVWIPLPSRGRRVTQFSETNVERQRK